MEVHKEAMVSSLLEVTKQFHKVLQMSKNSYSIKIRKLLLFLGLGLLGVGTLGGCSYTAPYVTDVYCDEQGNLIIKKNTIRFRPLTGPFPIGKISNGRTETTSIVRLAPDNNNSGKKVIKNISIKKLSFQLAELQEANNKKLAEIAELKAKIAEKEEKAQAGKGKKENEREKTKGLNNGKKTEKTKEKTMSLSHT